MKKLETEKDEAEHESLEMGFRYSRSLWDLEQGFGMDFSLVRCKNKH